LGFGLHIGEALPGAMQIGRDALEIRNELFFIRH
jgi:hypothetical protein